MIKHPPQKFDLTTASCHLTLLHPTSYILHPTFFPLPPASRILHSVAICRAGGRSAAACVHGRRLRRHLRLQARLHAPKQAHARRHAPWMHIHAHLTRQSFRWTQERVSGASGGVGRPYGLVGCALRLWLAVGASTGRGSEGRDRPRVRSGGVFTAPGGLHLAHTGQGRVLDAIPMRF